jgi:hypothetical protein
LKPASGLGRTEYNEPASILYRIIIRCSRIAKPQPTHK